MAKKPSRPAATRAGKHAAKSSRNKPAVQAGDDRTASSRQLRARLWVQGAAGPALTDAGADLLEQIMACGSLSEAARRLRYSYRRAWMLLNAMNRRWPTPLVRTAVGGTHGGGAQVTEAGEKILRSYRDIQLQIQHLLDLAGDPFGPLV